MSLSHVIFSDLDGTLLDHQSYEFTAAQPALNFIKENQVPLILVSSKTKDEMIHYQNELGISGLPFVVENGSAIYTEIDYFKNLGLENKRVSGAHECFNLGISFEEIKSILDDISKRHGYTIRGFHNISREEIQSLTGLGENELDKSLNREYSIPLLFDNKSDEILKGEIDKFNLQILYGGRFMHLLSRTDKGKAMILIMKGYRDKLQGLDLKTVAIGDSPNDYAMLKDADYPILVKKHDGSYDNSIRIESLIYSPGIGPEGWNISVLKILKTGGTNE